MDDFSDHTEQGLSKSEILRSKKIIKELFSKGSSFYIHPFRVKYLGEVPSGEKPQILVTIPKKIFKRAVDRNLLKRRTKEAYRINKAILLNSTTSIPQYMTLIYTDKEKIAFDIIQKKLILILQRLTNDAKHKS